ncbi:MAG: hypothetical protein ACM31C_27580 [Acidobacteriota bacterium]
MRTSLLLAIIVAACEKAHDTPPAPGSGSDAVVEGLLADMAAYGEKSLPIVVGFDGDCAKVADRMLTLEPLAKSIRDRTDQLEADPARHAAARDRMKAMKAGVIARYEAVLRPLGKTLADVDAKQAEMKDKCADDPRFRDAEQRTGLKKRK